MGTIQRTSLLRQLTEMPIERLVAPQKPNAAISRQIQTNTLTTKYAHAKNDAT